MSKLVAPEPGLVSVSDLLERLQQADEDFDDLVDLTLGAARMLTADPHRYSLEEVLAAFGYTREQRAEAPE